MKKYGYSKKRVLYMKNKSRNVIYIYILNFYNLHCGIYYLYSLKIIWIKCLTDSMEFSCFGYILEKWSIENIVLHLSFCLRIFIMSG